MNTIDGCLFLKTVRPALESGDCKELAQVVSSHWQPKEISCLLHHRDVDVRRVAAGDGASGSGWIGLRSNGAYRVTALEQSPLLPAWAALLLILGSLLLAWRMEGR